MYNRLLRRASYLGIFIFIINIVANKFYWYTSIFGFDKLMHTFGGVFIVLIVSSFFIKEIRECSPWQVFVTLVLSAFVVGLVWEYYEYIVQYYVKTVHLANITDSIGDLIFDCIGGALGSIFVILMNKSYNKQSEE